MRSRGRQMHLHFAEFQGPARPCCPFRLSIIGEISPPVLSGSRSPGQKGISPLPVALVEGRREAHWYLPCTADSLPPPKAKAAHQINPLVAQSKIGDRALDGFYTRDFDFRQGRCCGLGHPQRPRLLRMRCKRPNRSHAYKQADELAPPAHSITSSARASTVGGTSRPTAVAVLRLMIRWNFVGTSTGRSAGLTPRRMRST